MSTHNICFCRERRKILCGYPLLSVAMYQCPLMVPLLSGHLDVEIVPCTKDFQPVGEDDFVEDPKELVS